MKYQIMSVIATCAMLFATLADVADSGDEFTVKKSTKSVDATTTTGAKEAEPAAKPKKPPRKCWKCRGKGTILQTVREQCDRCEGTGVLITEVTLKNKRYGDDHYGYWTKDKKSTNKRGCPRCNRTGSVPVKKDVECPSCKGKGVL